MPATLPPPRWRSQEHWESRRRQICRAKRPKPSGGFPALYRKTHQPAKALTAIDRSISVLQRVEEAYDLPRFVAEKAEVEIELGNVRAADALYDRASSLIEGLLVNAPSSLVKSSMIAALSEIYIAHFRLAWNRLHDGPKAFQIIENVRGRTLYDSIRYARLTTPTDRQSPQELEIVRLQKSLLHEQLTAPANTPSLGTVGRGLLPPHSS